MLSDGGWHRDAQTVRALLHVIELGDGHADRSMPESRAGLVAVLTAARDRLRRRLLLAEGVDPSTGQPVA